MNRPRMMPTFEVGDRVRAVESYANRITAGNVYEVEAFIPYMCPDWFTYSEYVMVTDDHGRRINAHTQRFEKASQAGR